MIVEGDPKLYDTGDGSDLLIEAGQPVMDSGLENAVYLSLFSSGAWWGNAIAEGSEKSGSSFESVFRRTLTNATRLDAEQYARDALAWMVSEGISSRISVTASIPSVGMLGLVITIDQPGRTSTIRYQINWAELSVRTGAAA